jgi:hypothetical protein
MNNQIQSPSILEELNSFMMTTDNIHSIIQSHKENDQNPILNTTISTSTPPFSSKSKNDDLFQCFCLLSKYNETVLDPYLQHKKEMTTSSNKKGHIIDPILQLNERNIKIDFIEKLRNPQTKTLLFKGHHKIITLSNVETELSINPTISIGTFIILCRLQKVPPFTLIYKNSYYEFNDEYDDNEHDDNDDNDDDEHLEDTINCMAKKSNTNDVGKTTSICDCDNKQNGNRSIVQYITDSNEPKWTHLLWNNTELKQFKDSAFEIKKATKPYNAMTSYKIDELHNLYIGLGLGLELNGKKLTKQKMYDELKLYFNEYK